MKLAQRKEVLTKLLGDKTFEQSGGDSSINIQTQSLNLGLSYSEVKQIALDVFQANFHKLSQIACEIAQERAEQITDSFLTTLSKRAPNAIHSVQEPGMQYAIYTAQREYARTGDKDLADLLVDILVDRAEQPSRNLMQIVLDESLSIATKLTIQQMDTLSIVFILKYTKNFTISNIPTLHLYIDQYLVPFINNLTKERSCFQHLEYCGCGSISLGEIMIENIFRTHYPGIFSRGFTEESTNQILNTPQLRNLLVIPCFQNNALFQICAIDKESIDHLGKRHNITPEIVQKLKNTFDEYTMQPSAIKSFLQSFHPAMVTLLDFWFNSHLKNMTLTSVGIAIAHANIRRKTNEHFDLSIWIK